MKSAIAALFGAYLLSQFYRAFLAVLTPVLAADLGATPADLGRASGYWFLAFAAMQLPVGWALDRIGPRRTTAALMAVASLGAALFAAATTPLHIQFAMALIGIGCAPILMAAYFIFARSFPAALFGTLAGAMVGFSSLGNIASTLPLAWLVELAGWRAVMWGLAALTLAIALLVAALVTDPPPPEQTGAPARLRDVLAIRALWPIFPLLSVNYLVGGALRGLWVGPWLDEVQGLAATGIGWVTLGMGLATIAGSFVFGASDRLFRSRKRPILIANTLTGLGLLLLALAPAMPLPPAVAVILALGFFGATYPLVFAHGRAFLPPALTGRGVTLMNLFSIGGAGAFQWLSARVHLATGGDYTALFLLFALPILLGCALYALSRDNLG